NLLSGSASAPMPALDADPVVALPKDADRAARQAAQQQVRQQAQDSVLWWLDRMVAAEHQFAEKLVFFWHGHFATSVEKVRSAAAMLRQQQTFRDLGAGDFGPFLKAMLRDPALIVWLDGQQNTRAAPNENLARESMELFTLGVGNYTEADVRAAARALTGWQVRRGDATATFNPRRHDPADKTVLGVTGPLDTDGYADVLLAQPPSVGGWPAGAAWLSTSATEHRVALAALLAAQAGPAARQAATSVDGLARLLVVDGFTDRTRTVLSGAGKDPTRLLALGLASPE